MTNIEQKALALVNGVLNERDAPPCPGLQRRTNSYHEAIFRALEQKAVLQAEFDQHKRDVSDAVEAYLAHSSPWPDNSLRRFIIAKPDPLVEVVNELGLGSSKTAAEELRAALAKRNAKIVWEAE